MKQPADQPKKLIRLNKYLAQLGIASRRKIDQLIERNQVWVNDKRVDLGMKIDPARDSVRIGKKQIDLKYAAVTHEYWLANKPVGYVSTTQDEQNRPTVLSLVESKARLFPVGRLDLDSEGLILLTNNGELTQRLARSRQ